MFLIGLRLVAMPILTCCHLAPDTVHVTIAGRDIAVWKPEGPAPLAGYPLIVFSHGFTGCNTQSSFLMKALAQAGYAVVSVTHLDGLCGTARRTHPRSALRPEAPFADESRWSDTTYKERRADIETVLDTVLHAHTFDNIPIDSQHIGIAGHSLGGYTVLGLAGAWASWKDPRIKAVLALSPFCTPYVEKGDLQHLDVPIMYQGGTFDIGITPSVDRPHGAYDLSSAPKYYVGFAGAGHLAWTDLNPRYQSIVDRYSVAFFDRYLRGHPDSLTALETRPLAPLVRDLRFAEH